MAMSPKNPAAVALGRKGGKATAENRSAEQRSAAARKAVEARWAEHKKNMKQIDQSLATLEATTAKLSKAAQARLAKQKKPTPPGTAPR